jgi:type III secretion system HrpE/YscL family protein
VGRVIRGDGPVHGIVRRETLDARAEAERTLSSAQREASRLVEQARAEAEGIRAEAREHGARSAEADAARLLVEAARQRDRVLSQCREELARLAMAVAQRVIGDRVVQDASVVRHLVEQALHRARRAHRVSVHVHPDDAPAAQELARAAGASVTVQPDPTLKRGDCVLHTDAGDVDARIEVQLLALERALLGEAQERVRGHNFGLPEDKR